MTEQDPLHTDPNTLTPKELVDRLTAETGTTVGYWMQKTIEQQERIHKMVANTEGKFRVLHVDTYDLDDRVGAEFDSAEAAMAYVKRKTAEANAHPNLRGSRLDYSTGNMVEYTETTSRFYAYTPQGEYLDPSEHEAK